MHYNGPLVSIIVPIYMIDNFLGHCIESICGQSYKNLEIILVDDGSKDRCPEICDLYERKDSRITVIHKPNGGLVSARKAGLAASHGKYITYVDGDDWIGTGHISSMLAIAEAVDADMVCAGFTRNLFSKTKIFTNPYPSGVYSVESLVELWKSMLSYGQYYRVGIFTYVWNKLFKREILMGVQNNVDERITIGEDSAVVYPALLKCSRVALIDSAAYHYRQREDSMLKQKNTYSQEAQKLKYLYDYMLAWSQTTPAELGIRSQVVDHVLSMAIIRSGGRLPHVQYYNLEKFYNSDNAVLYSAGTFGQQIHARYREANQHNVKAWVDDYYRFYRRVCMDVDPVESLTGLDFEYILIATMDNILAEKIILDLMDLGITQDKILTITIPEDNKEEYLGQFLDIDNIRNAENNLPILSVRL